MGGGSDPLGFTRMLRLLAFHPFIFMLTPLSYPVSLSGHVAFPNVSTPLRKHQEHEYRYIEPPAAKAEGNGDGIGGAQPHASGKTGEVGRWRERQRWPC